MASEPVIRAEPPPPPPPVMKDSNYSRGLVDTSTEDVRASIDSIAFWIERFAVFLVFFCWLPRYVWDFLYTAIGLLILSNYIYLISFLSSFPEDSGRDESGMDEQKTEQEEVKLDFSLKEAKEEMKAKDKMNNIIDKENAGQQKAKLDDSPKESKEEGKAKDARINKINEENTEQEKAKLKVSLKELEVSSKELKEEVRSSSSVGEGFQSLEAKYLAKYENLLQKYLDKCHGNWEEERSQLMYELGAARASFEIYRALLHDLHYHQP